MACPQCQIEMPILTPRSLFHFTWLFKKPCGFTSYVRTFRFSRWFRWRRWSLRLHATEQLRWLALGCVGLSTHGHHGEWSAGGGMKPAATVRTSTGTFTGHSSGKPTNRRTRTLLVAAICIIMVKPVVANDTCIAWDPQPTNRMRQGSDASTLGSSSACHDVQPAIPW